MVIPNFSQNMNLTGLGSVSFQMLYLWVRFEYWTIFEGYLRAEVLANIFGLSLIFSAYSYIFKFKSQKNVDSENHGNTSLAAPGALALRLQRRTACNT